MRSFTRAGLVVLGCMLAVIACGSAEPEQDAIRLQANAVGGGQVFYPDLASQDTVLWFWAPW